MAAEDVITAVVEDVAGHDVLPLIQVLKGKKNVSRADTSEVEFKAGKLPAEAQILVLKPAL